MNFNWINITVYNILLLLNPLTHLLIWHVQLCLWMSLFCVWLLMQFLISFDSFAKLRFTILGLYLLVFCTMLLLLISSFHLAISQPSMYLTYRFSLSGVKFNFTFCLLSHSSLLLEDGLDLLFHVLYYRHNSTLFLFLILSFLRSLHL